MGGVGTGGDEVFFGVGVGAGAFGEAFDIGLDAVGVACGGTVAVFEFIGEFFGDLFEVGLALVAEHDGAEVAAVGGGFEGGEEVFGVGVEVEEGLAGVFGEEGVADDGVVHEVVGECFEFLVGGSGGGGGGRCGGRCGGRGSGFLSLGWGDEEG